ncbi:hypothetical protein ATH50_3537 [Haloplanus aerogenes]|uniref:Uncharacterized protein n=1 Tax=Haloplanus aerogenes TaxID=660522 RepID=A0A3M0CG41_9EURY|nr:hypothetical protein ATH50_3537 [Haloplanus aerogenes]
MLFPLTDDNVESTHPGTLTDLVEHTKRQQRDESHREGSDV